MANKPNSIDAYKAVFSAGDNAYHVVKSLQENSLDEVISATMRDIQSERPDLYEIDARIQACLEVKCTLAAATGRGRGKRVRAALAEKKAKQVQTTPITNIQANLVQP